MPMLKAADLYVQDMWKGMYGLRFMLGEDGIQQMAQVTETV